MADDRWFDEQARDVVSRAWGGGQRHAEIVIAEALRAAYQRPRAERFLEQVRAVTGQGAPLEHDPCPVTADEIAHEGGYVSADPVRVGLAWVLRRLGAEPPRCADTCWGKRCTLREGHETAHVDEEGGMWT